MTTFTITADKIKPHKVIDEENHIRITIPMSISQACGMIQSGELTIEHRIGKFGPFVVLYDEKAQKEWAKNPNNKEILKSLQGK